uniref:energy-coupling factor transporter transmembrane component T family protein n=1 Tax=Yoonia sp. TaxID=2212373 RepID=UPI004048438D
MISLSSPVKTRAHNWPAGMKLAGLCAATIVLFFIENLALHAAILVAVAGVYLSAGALFFKAGLRQLRVLWPFVVIVAIWHIWTGETQQGAVILLRLLSALALANLVTMTTRLSDMIDVVRLLTRPLAKLGLNPAALDMAIALVIRLTPVLAQKGRNLTQAWRARSARRPNWRILLPFTVLALDDADHVAEALRARGGFTPLKDP